MADYVQKLRDDLVEQFKGKPVIDALMEAVGDELNEVRQFYEDLRDKRNIPTAVWIFRLSRSSTKTCATSGISRPQLGSSLMASATMRF